MKDILLPCSFLKIILLLIFCGVKALQEVFNAVSPYHNMQEIFKNPCKCHEKAFLSSALPVLLLRLYLGK